MIIRHRAVMFRDIQFKQCAVNVRYILKTIVYDLLHSITEITRLSDYSILWLKVFIAVAEIVQ